jgi:hypothetical protein
LTGAGGDLTGVLPAPIFDLARIEPGLGTEIEPTPLGTHATRIDMISEAIAITDAQIASFCEVVRAIDPPLPF